jgi:hypothetical protein
MNDKETVRDLKRRLTTAIWQEALAHKNKNQPMEDMFAVNRSIYNSMLLKLSESWGKK